MVPLAVSRWRRQNYQNCQLAIVADTLDDLPHGWRCWNDPQVDVLVLFSRLVVGVKRNEAIELCNGEYIALFDDDDYSAPGRISQQVAELERTGAAVTGYQSMKFTDGSAWWNFPGPVNTVIGSSLCFRRDWWAEHPFPALQIGEDAGFVEAAHLAGKLAACPDLGLMYASIHPGNTSKRDLTKPPWEALPGFEWKDSHGSKVVL